MSILCSMVGASFTVAAAAEVIRKKTSILSAGSTVSTTQSKFGGSSATFNGSSQYINVPHQTQLDISAYSNWTIECWSRLTEGTGGTILNKDGIAGSIYPGYTFYTNGSKQVTFGVGGSAGNWVTVTRSTALADNTWYHLAAVKNGATVTFYVDGVSAGTATFVGYTDQSRSLYIGWEASGTYMYGYIDEVRISNTARYTTTFTSSTTAFVNDANTVFLMHANGTNASTFFEDDNGVRAPIGLAAGNNAKISTAQSKFGGSSIEFDGADDFVTVTGLPSTTTGDCTYEFWGRFDILPWNQTYAGGSWMQIAYDGGGDYLIISRSGGSGSQVNLQIATGNRYGAFTKSGVNLAINTWYHIAYVRSSGVWKAFFNGTELTSFTNESNFTNSGRTENVRYGQIGKFSDGRGSWDGYMDEIRFSNSARYTADYTPPTAPFVNDANTLLLIHADGTNASTVFRDDNGARAPKGISAIGNAQIDTAQSKFGGVSALFDGTGDWLKSDFYPEFNFQGDFTIEGWFRLTANEGAYTSTITHAWGITGGLSGWYFSTNAYNGTQKLGFSFVTNSGSKIELNYGSTLPLNTWMHLAVCRDGNKLYFYKDGVLLNSGGYTLTEGLRGFAGNYDFGIGASPFDNSGAFNGWMDEIRISNSARYPAGTTFTAPTAPFQNDANTLLLLHMDGSDASTVFTDDNGIAPYTP